MIMLIYHNLQMTLFQQLCILTINELTLNKLIPSIKNLIRELNNKNKKI